MESFHTIIFLSLSILMRLNFPNITENDYHERDVIVRLKLFRSHSISYSLDLSYSSHLLYSFDL